VCQIMCPFPPKSLFVERFGRNRFLDAMNLIDSRRYLVGPRKRRLQIINDSVASEVGPNQHRPKHLQLEGAEKEKNCGDEVNGDKITDCETP